MSEAGFNMSLRRFLKRVGISSQQEIEAAARAARETGALEGIDQFDVTMTLESGPLGLHHAVRGTISLKDEDI